MALEAIVRSRSNIRKWLFAAGIVASAGQGCSPFSPMNNSSGSLVQLSTVCEPRPDNISGSPKTIEEAILLINALPKPLSVACFIQSLDRPLNITMTTNIMSAQPAVGKRSPRIFIVIDKLYISVVPEGVGASVVEFSFLTNATLSVKAEIPFPVIGDVALNAPFDRIRLASGTTCGLCHTQESPATEINYANAFKSVALRPNNNTLVPLSDFRQTASACDWKSEPERCGVITSIFNGPVQTYIFPQEFPFF